MFPGYLKKEVIALQTEERMEVHQGKNVGDVRRKEREGERNGLNQHSPEWLIQQKMKSKHFYFKLSG